MKKNHFLSLLFAVCSVCFPVSVFSEANPIDRAVSELIYEKDAETTPDKTEKPFSSTVSLGHNNGFINSSDRINQLSLTGQYNFLKFWSFSLSQNLNQHYLLNPLSKDKGIWIQDTLLLLQRQFKKPSLKSSFTTGVSSTLPLSHYSQVNDIYTVSTAYLVWSLKLDSFLKSYKPKWIKNITFSVKPIARYYFTEYTTTPTEGQSSGGTPLPQFLAGIQSLSLKTNITDRLSLTGTYGQWVVSTYTFEFDKKKYSNTNYKKYLRHYYLFSLVGNFKIHKQWNLSFSYSHVDRMDKEGRVEFVFLDDRLSIWSLSVTYAFSFNLPKD